MKNFLNVGCGSRYHKDWTNIDMHSKDPNVISADLTKGFPFPDQSFDFVYHSHVLEHIPKQHVDFFIGECYRVLKKGGILRVVVPDLEFLVSSYLRQLHQATEQPNNDQELGYDWSVINLLDQMIREKTGGETLRFYENHTNYLTDIPTEGSDGLAAERNNAKMGFSQQLKRFLSKSRRNQRDLIMNKLIGMLLPKRYKEYYQLGVFRKQGEIHQWMYDRFSLSRLLQQHQLTDVSVFSADKSLLTNWEPEGLDIEKGNIYKPNSLFVEGKK